MPPARDRRLQLRVRYLSGVCSAAADGGNDGQDDWSEFMRWLLALALPGLICLMPRPAAAGEFMDGKKLLQLCASDDPYNGLECTGYVKGVADAFAFQMDGGKRPLCMPNGVTAKQLIE